MGLSGLSKAGYGTGYVYGSGTGYGTGYGEGSGNGYGSGCVAGYGEGSGSGYGSGTGSGSGYGSGYVEGSGYGTGYVNVPHENPVLAWHYANRDGSLNYDLAGVEVYEGQTLHCDPENVALCYGGLHASMTPKEARQYKDGILCRVAISGRVQWGQEKLCGSRRVVVEVTE